MDFPAASAKYLASLGLKITHYYSVVADLIPSREFTLVNVPAGPFS